LIGRSIYLRPVETEDAPALVAWFNDPEVTRTLRHYLPMSLAKEKAFLEQLTKSETDLALAIVVRETDQFIGVTGLHHLNVRHRHVQFGISIGVKALWGKGYGTEATQLLLRHAFQTLNLNRVQLEVYEFNKAAIRCYEKTGFQIEGRLRQTFFAEGRYWDTLMMGILRDEWRPAS
jgi:UDP-4-amino-4,6-dideoxy-N-acetyl-beta-L-altrosamine N-acetyltransferase